MMRVFSQIALASAFAVGIGHPAASAPPLPGGKPVVDEALKLPLEGDAADAIVKAPSDAQMGREYPQLAAKMGLSGGATITCAIQLDGALADCTVAREKPAGLGFGAAALRLAPYFAAKPALLAGKAVVSPVSIPIYFRWGGARMDPPPLDLPPPISAQSLALAHEVLEVQGLPSRLHRSASAQVGRFAGLVAAAGDGALGSDVLDAYRQAFDDAVTNEIERRAHFLATNMTADQLGATLVFLKSSAGSEFRKAEDQIDDMPNYFTERVDASARAHLCSKITCDSANAVP